MIFSGDIRIVAAISAVRAGRAGGGRADADDAGDAPHEATGHHRRGGAHLAEPLRQQGGHPDEPRQDHAVMMKTFENVAGTSSHTKPTTKRYDRKLRCLSMCEVTNLLLQRSFNISQFLKFNDLGCVIRIAEVQPTKIINVNVSMFVTAERIWMGYEGMR